VRIPNEASRGKLRGIKAELRHSQPAFATASARFASFGNPAASCGVLAEANNKGDKK